MKWLLITTRHTNPGDEFVRIGVQNLIREVDPNPVFDLLNKENPMDHKPREFDKCVLCGMPLFWSGSDQPDCTKIWWWEPLMRGWPTARKKDFLALGVGEVTQGSYPVCPEAYGRAVEEIQNRAFAITFRQPVLSWATPGTSSRDSVCPAAFAVDEPKQKRLRICNLMPRGGHFPISHEQTLWHLNLPELVEFLLSQNFSFSAHTEEEETYARGLGWPFESIYRFRGNPQGYLDLYAQAELYFGNRLHPAVVVSALGRPAWGVAFDSRIRMVFRVGGQATIPSRATPKAVREWFAAPFGGMAEINRFSERKKNVDLLRRFVQA